MKLQWKPKVITVGMSISLTLALAGCGGFQDPPPDETKSNQKDQNLDREELKEWEEDQEKIEKEEEELHKEHNDTDTKHPNVPDDQADPEEKPEMEQNENYAG